MKHKKLNDGGDGAGMSPQDRSQKVSGLEAQLSLEAGEDLCPPSTEGE